MSAPGPVEPAVARSDRPAAAREPPAPERELSIALLSPGWPRAHFANGIVTGVERLRTELNAIGARTHVLAVEGGPAQGESDVHALPPGPKGGSLSRLARAVAWRIAPARTQRREMAERILRALDRLAVSGGVDILDMEESFGWAGEVVQRAGIPVVVTLNGPWFLHGPFYDATSPAAMRRRIRAEGESLRRARALLAPSQDVLLRTKQYYGLRAAHEEVIPFPVELYPPTQRWRRENCREEEVLFVGRFDRHKGGDIALDAFALVAAEHPRARLVFAGPDRGLTDAAGARWTLAAYAEARLPGALAAGRIELAGQLSPAALEDRRRRALVTVSCSRYENFSLASIEAMALGAPVVVADCGGLVEHVRDGETGLIFRAGDAAALADRILRLLRDPALAAQLGARAAERITREFDPRRLALRRLEFFRRVVREHRDGSGG